MREEPSSVLVTGAAGFVGGHLLDRLVSTGTRVVGWYRPGTPVPTRTDLEWRAVELLDRQAVADAVRAATPSQVYHLAGAAHVAHSWKAPRETYQNNVLATHHLFNALSGVEAPPRVLVSCSGAIYRAQARPLREEDPLAPGSPYATSKLAQEMLAIRVWQDDGLPALVARSFNHTGPGQEPSYVASGIARQIAEIEAGRQSPLLRMGNLDPVRDISDVRDVVAGYLAMMASATPGRPYNVCSGQALSIRTLVETFVARAQVHVGIEQDPALFRPSDAPMLVGDRERLTADTGWAPTRSLQQTVDDLLEFWRTRDLRGRVTRG